MIDQWGFYEPLGITIEECMEIFEEAWRDWNLLEPMEQDMWQKTHMLCNLGKTDIVTNARPSAEESIKKWLVEHNIEYNELIFSKEKWKLDYDVYIDDSPSNLQKVFDEGKVALIYNQPWNRHVEEFEISLNHNGRIQRVYNLYDAIDVIRSLKYGTIGAIHGIGEKKEQSG